jgi:hypothetical protein
LYFSFNFDAVGQTSIVIDLESSHFWVLDIKFFHVDHCPPESARHLINLKARRNPLLLWNTKWSGTNRDTQTELLLSGHCLLGQKAKWNGLGKFCFSSRSIMRRTPALAVDTAMSNEIQQELAYDLHDHYDSPRSSVYSKCTAIQPPHIPTVSPPTITPSIRLLFSQLNPRHRLFLLLPAVLTSLLSGGIAPFMTFVIGQAFEAFAKFPLTPNPPQSAKDTLLHDVGIAALELLGLAVGSLALGSLTSSLWIWTGERNVMALRKAVYKAVTHKDMVWFDTKMGSEGNVQSADGEHGPLGAGGLMAKFTRSEPKFISSTPL